MDEVREKLKNVGSLQKKIVIWLGDKSGVTSVEQLRSRWPSSETIRVPTYSGFKQLSESIRLTLNAVEGQTTVVPTKYAPYLKDVYFNNDKSPLDKSWIIWSPEKILGHKPSPAESASLSKGVRGLEERDLLKTEKLAGKNRRISHVKLTFYGEVATILLRQTQ